MINREEEDEVQKEMRRLSSPVTNRRGQHIMKKGDVMHGEMEEKIAKKTL